MDNSPTKRTEIARRPHTPESEKPPITVTATIHNYEKSSGILSLHVTFLNPSQNPIYVIAEDFAFLRDHRGQDPTLPIDIVADEITIDLSRQKKRTPDKSRPDDFGEPSYTPVIELEPYLGRSATYVFQFPVQLLHNGTSKETYRPSALKKVRLKFGWSRERLTHFVRRVPGRKDGGPAARDEQIRTEWQHFIVTEPVEVNF
jgi:hypothetical protein